MLSKASISPIDSSVENVFLFSRSCIRITWMPDSRSSVAISCTTLSALSLTHAVRTRLVGAGECSTVFPRKLSGLRIAHDALDHAGQGVHGAIVFDCRSARALNQTRQARQI